MEFPFGHRHHRRGEEEEDEGRRREETRYPPPGHQPHGGDHERPPPRYGGAGGGYQGEEDTYQAAPPPRYGGQEGGFYGEEPYQRPPPRYSGQEGDYYGEDPYQRPPPPAVHPTGYEPGGGYPGVQHVAHETEPDPYGREGEEGGRHDGGPRRHGFPFSHHGSTGFIADGKRTVKVVTKAAGEYSLSIRDGKVVLARADPTDDYQHWIKDEKFSTKVKDEEGLPCFSLVNKATGQAIKHSIGATHPVQLVPYNPDYLDESILWTESHDTGEGFRCIRMVNNIRLNFDAFHGDKDHGGVHDGTTVVLWEWLKGENQRWKIVPY